MTPDDRGASPVKFLMIVNDMDWFWYHRLPFAQAIVKKGWDMHLATHGAAKDGKIRDMGITGHDLPPHVSGVHPLAQIKLVLALVTLLRHVRPDIIHAITLRFALMTGLAALFAAPRTKLVFTMAGLGILFSSRSAKMRLLRFVLIPLLRFVFNRENTFVIFENPDDRNLLLKHRIVNAARSEVVLGSGVDPDLYDYAPENLEQVPMVLFSSRLLRDKGIFEFAQAAGLLAQRGVKARFVIAGKTYPESGNSVTDAQMNAWAAQYGLEWLGLWTDMPGLFKSCNIFVLPSYYGEGVPRVLLEAASTGRALITTDMPGCRETVRHGDGGLLIAPRDAGAIADAVQTLLSDPARRQQMGKAARAYMEERFTVRVVIDRTMAIYRETLAGR